MIKNIVVLADTYKHFYSAIQQRFSPDSRYSMNTGLEMLRMTASKPHTFTTVERGVTTIYRYVNSEHSLRGFQIDGVRIVVPYSRQYLEGQVMLDYLSHYLKEDVRKNKENFWYDADSPEGQKQLKLKIFDELGD